MTRKVDLKPIIYAALKTAGIDIRPFCVSGSFYDALYIPGYSTILAIDLADNVTHDDGPVYQNNLARQDGLKVFRIRTLDCTPLALDSFDYYLDDFNDDTVYALINYLATEFNGNQAGSFTSDSSAASSLFLFDYSEYDKYYCSLCCEYADITHHTALRKKEQYRDEHIGTWIHSKGTDFIIEHNGMQIRSRKTSLGSHVDTIHEVGLLAANKKIPQNWIERYTLLKQFYEENGHSNVPRNYNTALGNLGAWAVRQRKAYKNGTLSTEYIRLLNAICFDWSPMQSIHNHWDEMANLLRQYADEFNTTDIPQSTLYHGKPLGKWVAKQRTLYHKGMLSKDREEKLNHIDFIWRSPRSSVS